MMTDQCRGNQQLNADEEKEDPALELTRPLGNRESVRGEQKRERRAEEQEDSHG